MWFKKTAEQLAAIERKRIQKRVAIIQECLDEADEEIADSQAQLDSVRGFIRRSAEISDFYFDKEIELAGKLAKWRERKLHLRREYDNLMGVQGVQGCVKL